MARLIDLFTFSGKVGDVVGCKGPNGYYLRSKPRISTKPPTAKQLESRARLALVMDFLNPLREIIYLGFTNNNDRGNKTAAHSRAVSYATQHAISGEYPDLSINPSEVRLSRGNLLTPIGVTYSLSDSGILRLDWDDDTGMMAAFEDDRVFVVVYQQQSKVLLLGEGLRSTGTASVDLSTETPGTTWLVYILAAERDHRRFSDSQFLGEVVI